MKLLCLMGSTVMSQGRSLQPHSPVSPKPRQRLYVTAHHVKLSIMSTAAWPHPSQPHPAPPVLVQQHARPGRAHDMQQRLGQAAGGQLQRQQGAPLRLHAREQGLVVRPKHLGAGGHGRAAGCAARHGRYGVGVGGVGVYAKSRRTLRNPWSKHLRCRGD